MSKTILQIPLEQDIRDQATKTAKDLGFSSLQENIRVYLAHLIKGDIKLFGQTQPTVILSPQAAARYDQMIDDIESGQIQTYVADNVDDLMDQLNDKKDPVLEEVS